MATRNNKYFEGYIGINNEGEHFSIVSKKSYKEVYVNFKGYEQTVRTNNKNIARGSVRNPYKPAVYGIGYTGEAKTKYSDGKHTKPYIKWSSMIRRCYSGEIKYNNWSDCYVEEDWLCYDNFKQWYDSHNLKEDIPYHLDKDIMLKGNRVYGKNTCCLVPEELNIILTNRRNFRGSTVIGVVFREGKYIARISKEGLSQELGRFDEISAFHCYKKEKESFIRYKATECFKLKLITEDIFTALCNYVIEIDD